MGTLSPRRRVTLTDVAGRAGVSPSTASYILNGRSEQMRIAADTELRVQRVAEELGYRANRSARSLRTRRSATVGLVCDSVSAAASVGQMLSGASAAAREADHLLLIGESEADARVEAGLVDEMVSRQVDGIVYATVETSDVRLPLALHHHHVVLLNCLDPTVALPCVVPDEAGGGREVARLLVEAGAGGRVYFVGDRTPGSAALRRGELVATGLTAVGPGPGLAGWVECHADPESAYEAVRRWLARGGRATALVCSDDRIGVGACHALQAAGVAVPEDVSLVAFDGAAVATAVRPPLTTIAVPYAEMGALAVRTLLDVAPGRPQPGVVSVPMRLVAGGSVPGVHGPSTRGTSGPRV